MNIRLIGGPHDGEIADIPDVTEPGSEFSWPPENEAAAHELPQRYRLERDGAGHHVELPGDGS